MKGRMIWVKNGNVLEPQKVVLGETNEMDYEVISGLKAGDEVVVAMNGSATATAAKSEARSPFMPQRPGSNRK